MGFIQIKNRFINLANVTNIEVSGVAENLTYVDICFTNSEKDLTIKINKSANEVLATVRDAISYTHNADCSTAFYQNPEEEGITYV